jgi:hypothetical protein
MNHSTDFSGYHDTRKAPFIWVHTQAFDYLKGNLSAFGVYCWIIKRAGHGNNGKCWESIKNIASQLGISEGTAKRAIAYLLESKMLRRLSRPGKTSIYQVTNLEDWVYPTQSKNDPGEGGSKMTQVENDPGGWIKNDPGGWIKNDPGGGSKTTYELDPIELDPKESDPFFLEGKTKTEQPPVNPDRSLIESIDLGLDPENDLGAAAAKNLGALIPVVNAPVTAEKPLKVQTPSASPYCPVNINKWLQAWNESERPSKWPAMSIGMMSSQRTLDCLRQFIAHEDGDEDAAIVTLINRLGNAKKDPFWRDRTVSAYFLTDPNKLFLAQFDVADPAPGPTAAPLSEPTFNPCPTFFFGA